jgi:hypothetical protein
MSLFRGLQGSRTSTNNTSDENGDSGPTQTSDQFPPFDTPTPTPTRGIRRRRDSNDYSYDLQEDLIVARPAGTVPITPGTTKRLKVYCEDVARLHDVDSDQLVSFVEDVR